MSTLTRLLTALTIALALTAGLACDSSVVTAEAEPPTQERQPHDLFFSPEKSIVGLDLGKGRTARFPEVLGVVQLSEDKTKIEAIHLEIDVESLESGNEAIADLFKSSAVLDEENHETIELSITALDKIESEDRGELTHIATGRISMRGATRPFEFDVALTRKELVVKLLAEVVLARGDFGFSRDVIDETATLALSLVFGPAPEVADED